MLTIRSDPKTGIHARGLPERPVLGRDRADHLGMLAPTSAAIATVGRDRVIVPAAEHAASHRPTTPRAAQPPRQRELPTLGALEPSRGFKSKHPVRAFPQVLADQRVMRIRPDLVAPTRLTEVDAIADDPLRVLAPTRPARRRHRR